MKTTTWLILSALLLTFHTPSLRAGGRKTVRLVPTDGRAVTLLVGDKKSEYYLLGNKAPIRLQVDGPGKLTVTSRLKLPAGETGSRRYSVRAKEGNNTVKMHTTQTEKSSAVFSSSGEPAGKSRKFTIKIPEGSFTYAFYLEDTEGDAALRFTFQGSKRTGKRVTIEPLSYDRVVTATVNEKLLAYYVSSDKHRVKLRVVGPTKVRVTTRLNFTEKMKGSQKFSVVVSEKGAVVLARPLQTTKSVGLSYREWKEVVPGKAMSFSFDVPGGEHVYTFGLDQTLASAVSLRFFIPKDDLSNGE